MNIVRGGSAATLASSKLIYLARIAYAVILAKTGSKWLARAASLSTSD